MADETKTNETQESVSPEEALARLMRESVPKEKFDALQKQYNDFFASVANGSFTTGEEAEREPTEDEKQQEFYRAIDTIYKHKFHGSAEFMKNAVIIDDYLVSHGQRSAFAPSRGELTPDIEASTENFNELLKDCLEAGDGDDTLTSAYFAKQIDTPYKTGTLGK